MIETTTRLRNVEDLMERGQYFVIHAPRQSGKTTYLRDWANRLNTEGKYHCIYCSFETIQDVDKPETGIPAIVRSIKMALEEYNIPLHETFAANADFSDFKNVMQWELWIYGELLDKRLIILFDEIDRMSNTTMLAFLWQLYFGYLSRHRPSPPFPFIDNAVLVGMRNIFNYRNQICPNSGPFGSATPFKLIVEPIELVNFTKEEITELYAQHTAESGQIFEPKAIDLVFEKTLGQPWLVNAIAREVIVNLLHDDYSQPVTADLCRQAIQNIVIRRDGPIGYLLERLEEDHVRRAIKPLFTDGEYVDTRSVDFLYAKDLGLVRFVGYYNVELGNPIYGELIEKALTASS